MSCIYLSALEPCSWTTCTDTGHALCHDNLLKAHIPHAQPPVNRLAMTSMLEARYTHVLSKKQHEAIQTCRYTCNYVTMQNILLHLVHMETYSSFQKKFCKLVASGSWRLVVREDLWTICEASWTICKLRNTSVTNLASYLGLVFASQFTRLWCEAYNTNMQSLIMARPWLTRHCFMYIMSL